MECCYIWVSEDCDVLARNLKEAEFCMSNTFLLLSRVFSIVLKTHHLKMVSSQNVVLIRYNALVVIFRCVVIK